MNYYQKKIGHNVKINFLSEKALNLNFLWGYENWFQHVYPQIQLRIFVKKINWIIRL